MAKDEKPNVEKEANGVVQDFLQTLGLAHIILGGLTLYWLRLWYGTYITTFFPLTDYNFVNMALLACGAAAIGMIISFGAAILMGIMWYIIEKTGLLGYYQDLTEVLQKYRQLLRQTHTPPQDNANKIGLAASYIIAADSNQRLVLEKIKTQALLSYSIALLSILYTVYLGKKGPFMLWKAAIFCILIFFILGFFLQLDYIQTLRNSLIVLLDSKSDASLALRQQRDSNASKEVKDENSRSHGNNQADGSTGRAVS
jgi:uncharacterized membrane protein YagU involved in acid resistance